MWSSAQRFRPLCGRVPLARGPHHPCHLSSEYRVQTRKACILALASDSLAQTPSKPMPQFYELRQYHLRTTMRQDFSDYLKDVSVPALNRAGSVSGPVLPAPGVGAGPVRSVSR